MRRLLICLLTAVLVAGCQGLSLSPHVDSLSIVRRSPLRFLPPLDRSLADQATVRRLYSDLQAMPKVAPGRSMSCPENNGVTLNLTFKNGDSVVVEATAEAAGCRIVRLSTGGARYGAGPEGQRFFTDLARALGLSGDALAGFIPPTPPTPAGNGSLTASTDLLALHMTDAQSGWALSSHQLYRTDNSGVTWTAVTPPGAVLAAQGAPSYVPAFFLGADRAWVTTSQQHEVAVFRTTDGGRTWQKAAVPVESAGGAQLSFVGAREGWLLVPEGAGMFHEAVALYHTNDGGATWNLVAETHPQNPQLTDIPFVGDKTGIAFIDSRTGWITGYEPVSGQVYFYVTHDGGKTWAEQPLQVPTGLADAEMSSFPPEVFGPDVAVLPVQTTDAIFFYVTHDAGATWTAGAPVALTEQQGRPVWAFADVANGVVADGNRLWQTSDGGKTWAGGQPVAALQDVRQIDFTGIGSWALTGDAAPTRLRLSIDGLQTWVP